MSKNNHRITEKYSAEQLDQTDFGEIYFNLPSHVDHPTTIGELSKLLRLYNERGTPVVVRNTGHSTNGQTLTSGVQINLSKMRWSHFDEEKQEVRFGAGISWDDLLKTIRFPEFCPLIFPSNPGQKIHVTGQIAVGGIGFFSSRYGGLWNYVKEITLVTMQGDVITCSREMEPELFAYSLGGYGRIGVIAEAVLDVRVSARTVIPLAIAYTSHTSFKKDVVKMMHDEHFDGVLYLHEFLTPQKHERPAIPLHTILVFLENGSRERYDDLVTYVRSEYAGNLVRFSRISEQIRFVDEDARSMTKRDLVYLYPQSENFDQYQKCHPWNDYIVSPKMFSRFYDEVEEVLGSDSLRAFALKEEVGFGDMIKSNFDVIGYGIRNIGLDEGFSYPLCLDIDKEPVAIHIGSSLTVPVSMLDEATSAIDELTHTLYKLGGKRYLYGYHSLTKIEVEKQYGRSALEKWQQLKDVHDPHHLLNIGVIEHVDE